METFSALLPICAGNSPVIGEFPTQRPVTRSFDVSFALRLNKRLSKQWWGWWFETLSRPLWRHRNVAPFSIVFLLSTQHRPFLLAFQRNKSYIIQRHAYTFQQRPNYGYMMEPGRQKGRLIEAAIWISCKKNWFFTSKAYNGTRQRPVLFILRRPLSVFTLIIVLTRSAFFLKKHQQKSY